MNKKIVVVSNSKTCGMYEAKGLKILQALRTIKFEDVVTKHDKPERTGLYRKGGLPRSGFELKTTPQVIDRNRFCAKIVEELTHIDEASHYDEIIIVADPKGLGVIRKIMSKAQGRKVSKEISKDLTHLPLDELEQAVFE